MTQIPAVENKNSLYQEIVSKNVTYPFSLGIIKVTG